MYSAELKKIVEVFELESVLPELSLEGRSVLRREINRHYSWQAFMNALTATACR